MLYLYLNLYYANLYKLGVDGIDGCAGGENKKVLCFLYFSLHVPLYKTCKLSHDFDLLSAAFFNSLLNKFGFLDEMGAEKNAQNEETN